MAEETAITVDDSASVSERFFTAISLVDSAPQNAIVHLEQLQKDVTALALFSSNESIEDISTKSLPLIALEFHLAMAHLQAPTTNSVERKSHVTQSITLFSSFLQQLEQLELLSKEHTREYHELMNVVGEESAVTVTAAPRTAGQQREQKIARFRAKQQAQKEVERLKSLQQRRGRLETDHEEEMDGYDEESLQRQVALTTLTVNETEALDEWYQALRELPMIQMACQMEEERSHNDRYSGIATDRETQDSQNGPSGKPLQLTHITQNVVTGQLQIRKEEVRSQVFRPGWNQPTMTLQELGEMELKQAMEREAQQKIAKEENKLKPRRYDQLVKDGLEDNVDLVDASAELDRQWDNFKDENPRGSGNKMGDRGDRNF
jgi:hypothetical protein